MVDEAGKEEGTSFVGVKRNVDGTHDFSSALLMRKELKISDPIVDRLRGPLVTDEDREEKYRTFQSEMIKKKEAGEINTWLINTLNGIKQEGFSDVTQEDVASLQLVTDAVEIQELREQYAYDFARPYFRLRLGDYKKVYEKLTGRRNSNGCIISGGKLDSNPLTAQIGITLAPSLDSDTIHELGHTIDPNLNKRSPKDEVLEEFSTYYRETYEPRVYVMSTREKRDDGTYTEPVVTQREVYQNPKKIGATLKGDAYSVKYAGAFKSEGEYQERVDNIVGVIEQLEKYMSKKDINKAIYNAESFYELSHLLDVIKREKGQ